MDITQVKVFPVHEDKLKAFVSVVFDHCFMVNDIKVIQGKDGLFLSMPSRRKKSGEFKDVAHPLNNETRRMLEEKVLAEYRSVADDATPRRPDREAPREASAASAGSSIQGLGGFPAPAAGEEKRTEPLLPPIAASQPLAAAAERNGNGSAVAAAAEDEEKTLEEVQEMHLRDSFWTVS